MEGGEGGRPNSASCKGCLRVELTNIYAYHCTPYTHTKFQLSILINKKVGPSAPRKGRFAARRGVNPHICISLYFILYEHYAYQISTFYLDK